MLRSNKLQSLTLAESIRALASHVAGWNIGLCRYVRQRSQRWARVSVLTSGRCFSMFRCTSPRFTTKLSYLSFRQRQILRALWYVLLQCRIPPIFRILTARTKEDIVGKIVKSRSFANYYCSCSLLSSASFNPIDLLLSYTIHCMTSHWLVLRGRQQSLAAEVTGGLATKRLESTATWICITIRRTFVNHSWCRWARTSQSTVSRQSRAFY